MNRLSLVLLGLSCAAAAGGCKKKTDLADERGAAPPPVASTKPGICASGGGHVSDPNSASVFPRIVGDYCIDPNGETRAYGENARSELDKACTELFDGECEVYKRYGLKRVVTLRYVDGKGSPAAVNVNLSRFDTKDGAYGFFTKRVIADADPAESAPAPLAAGGAAAIGSGIAYVWRGTQVAELSYTNELESPDQLKATSQRVLPTLAKELGERLPGDKAPPSAVSVLPEAKRVDLGIAHEPRDVLGVSGTGPGAVGYYKDGAKRWRVFVAVRPDEDSAEDVMKTFKKLDGARAIKNAPVETLSFSLQNDDSSPKITWFVARRGAYLFGVADDEAALAASMSPEQAKVVSLSEEQKLDLLKSLVQSSAGAAAPSPRVGERGELHK